MNMTRGCVNLLLLGALGGVSGCATTGYYVDDTLESYNRAMFKFNDGVDKAILKPVATGYKAVLPEFARTGVTNFFSNLGDVWIGVNNILQGKIVAGASDFGRFAVNSTAGVLGLIDVASGAGLEKHNEDFGQTLGWWGVGSGAYVVLPLLGPSTVRDAISRFAVDTTGDPLRYVDNVTTRNELYGVRVVDGRANLLDVSGLAEEAALDHYSYVRGAYLQRRRSLIYDGNPPRERDPDRGSQLGPGAGSADLAEAELPPARLITERGEPVRTAADREITSAQEFSNPRTQLVATVPAAGGRPPSYQPMVPRNYAAVLAIPAEVGAGSEPAGFRQ